MQSGADNALARHVGEVEQVVVLLLRRRWKPVVVTLAIILPMIALYAAVVAVTNWEPDVMYGLAPRLLIHLLGPGLYALAAALHVTAAR